MKYSVAAGLCQGAHCGGFGILLFFESFMLLRVVFQRQIMRNALRFF